MSQELPAIEPAASLALRFDEICDQFEADLLAGKAPRSEDYLCHVEASERDSLAAELLLLTAEYRSKGIDQSAAAHSPGRLGELFADTVSTKVSATGLRPATNSGLTTSGLTIVLSVVAGPNQGQKFTLTRDSKFLVGRSATAHLRLTASDHSSSRLHCQIESTSTGCRLINLSGTNGTFLNGQRVETADLSDGDVILAGETAIRVRIQPA